ncbi:MAG: Crp/Fnr family transcriptional regulator [Thioalkalivibrio sp.]|nr:Crp/Fnr family transcriptional regulator [Thioalkalivibrio sp.]
MDPFPFPHELLRQAREISLAKNERLFSLGATVDQVFFVIAGEIRAVRHLSDGSEAVMMRARGGEFFALAGMFLTTYPCDAVASLASQVRIFPRGAFQQAVASDVVLASALVRAMAGVVKTQCARVERLRLKRVRDRVVHYLACESPDGIIHLNIPLLEWADELGSEPETLYRVLRDLEREGLITRSGRTIGLVSGQLA